MNVSSMNNVADFGVPNFAYTKVNPFESEVELTEGESENAPITESRDINESGTTYTTGTDNYPQHNDTFLKYFGLNSRGLLLHYWAMGFSLKFLSNPIAYYVVHVKDKDPEYLTAPLILMGLPYSCKFIFGFLSDKFPIAGFRRKPYIALGWALFCISNLILVSRIESFSVNVTMNFLVFSSWAIVLADVAADGLLVEWSKEEVVHMRGNLQLYCYTTRSLGCMIGSIMGAFIYDGGAKRGWRLSLSQTIMIQALQPMITVLVYTSRIHEAPVSSGSDRIGSIFRNAGYELLNTVSYKAVYTPCLYLILQSVFTLRNCAWFSFLVHGLNFSIEQTGILGIICSIVAVIGLMFYKRFLNGLDWRHTFVGAVLLCLALTLLQLVLILQLNAALHIPNMVFAAFEDVALELVKSFMFVVSFKMLILMCKEGSEGLSYSFLTSATNLGVVVSQSISTLMLDIWDVSNAALRAHKFQGIMNLNLLTACCSVLPLALVFLIPRNAVEQTFDVAKKEHNWFGGVIFIAWVIGGIAYSFFTVIKVYTKE